MREKQKLQMLHYENKMQRGTFQLASEELSRE